METLSLPPTVLAASDLKEYGTRCPTCRDFFTTACPAIRTLADSVCSGCYDAMLALDKSQLPATKEVDVELMAFVAKQFAGVPEDQDMEPSAATVALPSLGNTVDGDDVDVSADVASCGQDDRVEDMIKLKELVNRLEATHETKIMDMEQHFQVGIAKMQTAKAMFVLNAAKAIQGYIDSLMVTGSQQAARGQRVVIPTWTQVLKALPHFQHKTTTLGALTGALPAHVSSETVAVSLLYKHCMRAFENNYKMDATPEERPDDDLLDYCTELAKVCVTNVSGGYDYEDALTIGNVVKSITMFRAEIFDDRMCVFAGAYTACIRRAAEVIVPIDDKTTKWNEWLKERARYMLEEFAAHGNKLSRERRLLFVSELGIHPLQLGSYVRELYTDTSEGSMVRMLLGIIDAKSVASMKEMGRPMCDMVVQAILTDPGNLDYFSKYYAAELDKVINDHIARLCAITNPEQVSKGDCKGPDGTTVPMAFQRFVEENIV